MWSEMKMPLVAIGALFRRARVAVCLVAAALGGCSTTTAPATAISGTFVLDTASGAGPATGTLILTAQGYAERRVRFRLSDSTLSREYLARGIVTVGADQTAELELREMDLTSSERWKSNVRLMADGLEVEYPNPADGAAIVESYRRK